MIGKVNRLVKAAASASLVAGAIVATAGPAAAASPNSADAASATGLITAGPLVQATYPGNGTDTLASVTIPGLLTTGIVTDTATATSSSSNIANASATLTALASLTASAVSSTCSFNANTATVSGSSNITDAAANVLGNPAVTLTADGSVNQVIGVNGVLTVTLNHQVTAADGTLTVDAIYVQVVGGTQTLALGTSVCNAADLAPVPVLPGMALPIGLGALGVFGLGGLGFVMARRRRTATAA